MAVAFVAIKPEVTESETQKIMQGLLIQSEKFSPQQGRC